MVHGENQMRLEEIRREIRKMDPNVNGQQMKAALVLLSALQVGTDVDVIAAFTKIRKHTVEKIVERCRQNGIFQGDQIAAAWFDDDGGIAFWCDVNCAVGLMKRTAA
jgi:hypothetical protein